jgi:hypothetical protein
MLQLLPIPKQKGSRSSPDLLPLRHPKHQDMMLTSASKPA